MPSVFFSYTHDSDTHRERVRLVAVQLQADLAGTGVEVVTDHSLPPGGPDIDFRRWSEQNAGQCDLVIPVFNATYRKCWDGEHPSGVRNGGTNEATVIAARVNREGGNLPFIRVVIFDAVDKETIPDRLVNMKTLLLDRDYHELHAWIRLRFGLAMTAAPAVALPAPAWPPLPTVVVPVNRDGFVNCNPAFEAFERMLVQDASKQILFLRGPGEHGKSELLTRFWQHARTLLGPRSAATVQFKKPASHPEEYVRDIAVRLGIAAPTEGTINERLDAVLDACVDRPVVLFFDVFDEAEEQHRYWVHRVLDRIPDAPLLRCVVAGRAVPSRDGQLWKSLAAEAECDLFHDPDSVYQFACSLGFTGSRETIDTLVACFRNLKETHGLTPKSLLLQIEKLCGLGGTARP